MSKAVDLTILPEPSPITDAAARTIAKLLLRVDPPAAPGVPDAATGILTDEEFFGSLHVLASLDMARARTVAQLILSEHPNLAQHDALRDLAGEPAGEQADDAAKTVRGAYAGAGAAGAIHTPRS